MDLYSDGGKEPWEMYGCAKRSVYHWVQKAYGNRVLASLGQVLFGPKREEHGSAHRGKLKLLERQEGCGVRKMAK